MGPIKMKFDDKEFDILENTQNIIDEYRHGISKIESELAQKISNANLIADQQRENLKLVTIAKLKICPTV